MYINQQKEFPLERKAREMGAFDRKSLLLTAPTGTGKSHIGARILCHYLENKPAGAVNTYLVPFKALAEEVFRSLRDMVDREYGGRYTVRIATGDYTDPIDFSRTDILVATYEKFQALVQRPPLETGEERYLPYIVVMDEFHMVGDEERGPRLESLMSHLLTSGREILIFPLSAAVGNPGALARWLGVGHVEGKEEDRVVQVEYSGKIVSDKDEFIKRETRALAREGLKTIVFCPTKRVSEAQAMKHAEAIDATLDSDRRRALGAVAAKVEEISSAGSIKKLAGVIRKGVAFHHAGLEPDVRGIVEDAYRSGPVYAIFATPTLSSGVNLPAYAVIVRDAYRESWNRGTGRREHTYLSSGELLNMLGRSGRYGKVPKGVGYVLFQKGFEAGPGASEHRRRTVEDLIKRVEEKTPSPIESHLGLFHHILRHVLATVNARGALSMSDIVESLRKTLWCSLEDVDLAPVLKGIEAKPLEKDLMEEMEETLAGRKVKTLGVKVRSVEFKPRGIVASVTGSKGDPYEVLIEPEYKSCSCADFEHRRRYDGTSCKHIAFLVHHVLFASPKLDEDKKRLALQICLEHFGKDIDPANRVLQSIELLKSWGFVSGTEDGLQATDLGKVAGRAYIPIHVAYLASKRVKEAGEDATEEDLVGWAGGDCALVREEEKDYRDLLLSWIGEAKRDDIEGYFGYYQEFLNLVNDTGRILAFYEAVAEVLGKAKLAKTAHHARRRVEFGVKGDLIPLMILQIENLGPGRARELAGRGIRELKDLSKVNPATLDMRPVDKAAMEKIVARAKHLAEAVEDCRKNIAAARPVGAERTVLTELASKLAGDFGLNFDDVVEYLLTPGALGQGGGAGDGRQ